MPDNDVAGPVDFVLLEFDDPDRLDGSAATALLDLVDKGVVTVLDLLVIQKEADGTFTGIDIEGLSSDAVGGIVAFAGARSGLLGDDDLADAADALGARHGRRPDRLREQLGPAVRGRRPRCRRRARRQRPHPCRRRQRSTRAARRSRRLRGSPCPDS